MCRTVVTMEVLPMMTMTVKNVSVEIPETAEEWQIYSKMQGASLAAKALRNAMRLTIEEAAERVGEGYAPPMQTIHRLLARNMYQKMADLRAFGACDTEPREVALETLMAAVSKMAGYDAYSDVYVEFDC